MTSREEGTEVDVNAASVLFKLAPGQSDIDRALSKSPPVGVSARLDREVQSRRPCSIAFLVHTNTRKESREPRLYVPGSPSDAYLGAPRKCLRNLSVICAGAQ